MRSHSWWHDHSQDQQDHQYDHTYKWCYLGMQRPNEQWQRLWSWAINSNAGMTIHMISKITKKLQLTGPTSPSRSAHNERSLQRLWGYITIVFKAVMLYHNRFQSLKVWNSNTRGTDKAIIIILLTMTTCSILFSEHWHELIPKGTSRGSRSFPGSWAFLFENCWFGGRCKRPKILKCPKLQTKS